MQEEQHQTLKDIYDRLEKIENEIKRAKDIDELIKNNNAYKKEVAKLKAELRKTNEKYIFYKNELKIYQDSLSYKLGKSLVDILTNPLKIFLLPSRFLDFFTVGFKFIFRKYALRKKPKKIHVKKPNSFQYHPIESKTVNGKTPVFVDVVVCVHNALEDTKECLASLYEKRTIPFHLIIVDDGSDFETKQFLESFAENNKVSLFRNDVAQGYTIAANIGLRASTGDYVVLLNSDTVVTEGWLEKMMICCETDKETGIVGPLSNAASWQTVPEILQDGDWKVNTLPANINLDLMGMLVEEASVREFPTVPFVNGFCFMISRQVIDKIGVLDQDTFPKGYGEENDYCIRALDAGFKLRIADNTYIFHEKSKSFTNTVRKQLSPKASVLLKQKHGKEKVNQLINQIKYDTTFERIRNRIIHYINYFTDFESLKKIKIGFVLTAKGGGGGANSVVQEVCGLRKFGLNVTILNLLKYQKKFAYYYPEALEYTEFYQEYQDLEHALKNYDYVIGTIFTTIKSINRVIQKHPGIVPFYYAQDYEVLFFDKEHPFYRESYESYQLIQKNHLFAKTQWIINQIKENHDVDVTKVKPSVDTSTYNPFLRLKNEEKDQITISAMVRPQTSRRSPKETLELLRKIKLELLDEVNIVIFGCTEEKLEELTVPLDFTYQNLGTIPSKAVRDVLLKSDLFIDLSTYQAFGRTGIESMASGCVPILPKDGGVYEYAEDGYNALIVDTLDVDAVYEVLIDIIKQKNKLHEMKMNGLNTVKYYNIRQASFSECLMFYKAMKKELKLENNKKTIAYKIETRKNGCPTGASYVRILNPIYYIEKNHSDYQFIPVTRNTIDHLDFDYLLTHRNALSLNEMNYIKKEAKVLYDLDDNLLEQDDSLKAIIALSDKVTVTNQNLYDLIKQVNKNCIIVPNYLDSKLFFFDHQENFTHPIKTGKKQFVYLGTSSHQANLEAIKEDLLAFKDKTNYEIVTTFTSELSSLLPIRVDNYPNYIKAILPFVKEIDFGIAVLQQNEFNTFKSYLKYLEYTGFGLPGIYTEALGVDFNHVISSKENGLTVKDNKGWVDALMVMTDKHFRQEMYEKAYQNVLKKHLLEDHYHIWLRLFE